MKVKYKINRTALGSPWSKGDWNDAADHLIFDDHHLFHLNLAKKRSCILRGGGEGGKKHYGLRAPRLVGEVPQ